MAMDKGSQLFLIMKDREFRYCLYRVDESQVAPENSEDELTICKLEKPLLKMDKSTFPTGMSFVAVGSSIFMVGGYYSRDGNNPPSKSNKTFIYDTLSHTCVPGPTLLSGKAQPFLLTVGSKIFALSRFIYCYNSKCSVMDPKPRFEILDTEDLESGWSALPVPRLYVSQQESLYSVDACAVAYIGGGTSSAIFISVGSSGTYVFDLDKEVWNYVSDEQLPFCGHAMPMPASPNLPYAPSLCCATSSKYNRLSAFRFHFYATESDENKYVFEVDEIDIEIDEAPLLSPPLPPEICHDRSSFVFGPIGRVYFITNGLDKPDAFYTYDGNRYVKVNALEVCKVKLNKGQLLKRCKKRQMEHEEEPNETVKLGSNKGQLLKRCKKMKRQSQMGHKNQIGNDEEEEETVKLKMTHIWRRSFFGGPMCDVLEHVNAAFVI